jgi:branched-chain amino acid transport system substrate-binding protein
MKKLSMLSTLIAATTLLFSQNSLAADCDEIVIGSAISLTGKYATNGVHAKNGYEYAITNITMTNPRAIVARRWPNA